MTKANDETAKLDARAEMIERVRMAQGLPREKASDVEVVFLIDTAARLGLDPVQRQVWYQARADRDGVKKHQVLCTIDGLRVVAERSGEYEGQTEPQWCGKDGAWRDVWTAPIAELVAARVGVHRKGFRGPMFAVARFEAYCSRNRDGGLTGQWGKMGDHMISKCAEALALRKAFPQQLSGIYTNDEMRSDEHEPEAKPEGPVEVPKADKTGAKTAAITARLAKMDTPEKLKDWCHTVGPKALSLDSGIGRALLVPLLEETAGRLNLGPAEVVAWLPSIDDGAGRGTVATGGATQ